MKLFHHLSDLQQEHAVHHLQHAILNNLVDEGLTMDPPEENAEDLEQYQAVQQALEHIKGIEEWDQKMDYLWENEDVVEFSWQLAFETAHSAFFTEEGENSFHLPHIEEMFDDDTEEKSEETGDNVVQFPGGKKPSELN